MSTGWPGYRYDQLEPGGERTVTLATKGGALRLAFRENGGAVRFEVEQIESHGQGVACRVAEGVIGEEDKE